MPGEECRLYGSLGSKASLHPMVTQREEEAAVAGDDRPGGSSHLDLSGESHGSDA